MQATVPTQTAGLRSDVAPDARSPADQVEDVLALYDGDFRRAMLDLLTVATARTGQVSFGFVRGRF